MWIAIRQYGLVKFFPDTGEYTLYKNSSLNNSLSDDFILTLYVQNDSTLWIGTLKGGLNRFNTTTNLSKHFIHNPSDINSINDNHIIKIIGDKINGQDILWIGTGNKGLLKFNMCSEKFSQISTFQFKSNQNRIDRVFSILKTPNCLWVSTAGGGIKFFNTQQNQFTPAIYSVPENVKSRLITSQFKDNDGTIWLTTNNSGVLNFNPSTQYFFHLTESSGLRNKAINCVLNDSQDNLWIGTNKGVDKYIPSQNRLINLKNFPSKRDNLANEIVTSILESKTDEGVLWFGTIGSGLIRLDPKNNSFRKFLSIPGNSATIGHNTINAIDQTKNYIWLATASGGLNKLDQSTFKVKRYLHDEKDSTTIQNNFVTAVAHNNRGDLFVGTISGLDKFDQFTEKFKRVPLTKKSIQPAAQVIISLHVDEQNEDIIWVGTQNGLTKCNIKTGYLKNYTTADGICENAILGILPHANGNLWLSTNNGLSKFNIALEKFENFYTDDGLINNEFNINAFYRAANGFLYFGGTEGLTYFQPDSISVYTTNTRPIITQFSLLNKPVEIGNNTPLKSSIEMIDKITLNYDDYLFSFNFTAPNFVKPGEQQFAYMLKGFEDKWIVTDSKNRSATFTNIPNGEYDFIVKVSNKPGSWNEDYASVKIVILPPWWKTWWAYLLYGVTIAGMILGFVELRTRKTKKEKRILEDLVNVRTKELVKLNTEKDRFFSIVAHDIKGPLIAVLNLSKILKKRYNRFSEEEKFDSINEIYHSLDSSYRYLNNLLDWSRIQLGRFEFKPEVIDLQQLFDSCIGNLQPLLSSKNVNLLSGLKESLLAFADYEMIAIVLRNLISNGIKFTHPDGSVIVSAADKISHIEVTVEDNGVGIEEENLAKLFSPDSFFKTSGTNNETGTGLGLIICNELIIKNSGTIYAQSTPGKGSKFIFTLMKPLENQIPKPVSNSKVENNY